MDVTVSQHRFNHCPERAEVPLADGQVPQRQACSTSEAR
jgi:hypothetical protein